MKKNIVLVLFFSLFAGSLFFLTPLAQAQNPLDLNNQEGFNNAIPQAFGQTAGEPNDPRTIIINIVKIIFGFLFLIFLVLLLYAGFKWMTAAGNESQVEDAKKIITQAIIGLTVLLSAYSITYFAIKNIEKATQEKKL